MRDFKTLSEANLKLFFLTVSVIEKLVCGHSLFGQGLISVYFGVRLGFLTDTSQMMTVPSLDPVASLDPS